MTISVNRANQKSVMEDSAMWSTVGRAFILLLAATSVYTTASAGESVTYRGTGTYVVVRTVLPMANGGAAVHLVNDTVAPISGPSPV